MTERRNVMLNMLTEEKVRVAGEKGTTMKMVSDVLQWPYRDQVEAAKGEDTPVAVLLELFRHKQPEVRAAVASNFNLDLRTIIESGFLKPEDYAVLREIAQRSDLTPNLAWELYEWAGMKGSSHMLTHLSESPFTPSDLLRKLAQVDFAQCRISVASNENTPLDLIASLVDNEDMLVRSAVAENPCASTFLLDRMVFDKESYVRKGVAQSRHTPVYLLRLMATEEKTNNVRSQIVRNMLREGDNDET